MNEFIDWEQIGQVEVDRFCDGCGYNLVGKAVRRDPRTRVLMVRCSECGRFQATADATTAGKLWIRRLATLLLVGWVFIIFAIIFVIGAAQIGMTIGSLEECTTRVWNYAVLDNAGQVVDQGTDSPEYPGASFSGIGARYSKDKGYSIRVSSSGRVLRADLGREEAFMISIVAALSLLLGFVLTTLVTVICYHWRKRWYVVFILMIVGTIVGLLLFVWTVEAGGVTGIVLGYIAATGLLYLAGGILGITAGRAFARLVVRALIPPRLRPPLTFLWAADGLASPPMTPTTVDD